MKFSLYGMPCAGKTTLMEGLKIPVIRGSAELNKMASGKFSELSEKEKNKLRIKYAEQLSERKDSFISDGHYAFPDGVVFTDADAKLYDVFIYLYCEPQTICERLKCSSKNARFAGLSAEHIKKWQDFEIEGLRSECHRISKDFYVVCDISADGLQEFIYGIENGFGSYALAEKIVSQIRSIYPEPCELHICDGDKTIICQDSFRMCTDNYVTHAFDGGFYTGYQAFKFTLETADLSYDFDMLKTISLNDMVFGRIADKNYIVLSSGITVLWEQLARLLGIKNIIADTLISADTKYFAVKLLQEQGYTVTAYGDGKNDLYMLKKADTGYLFIGEYLSRSLREANISGVKLLYDKSPYIMENVCSDIADKTAVCKSTSGINGSKLAEAHMMLGKKLGEVIRELVPSTDTAVIVLERGGRFFGDGLYTGFGGTFYSYDPKTDSLPNITQSKAIIVDSVINTGKSVIGIINMLKKSAPDIEIYIAVNVIQKDALELFKAHKIFAVRTSSNSFVGSRQFAQKDGKGPDTADRLFNYISYN